MKPHVCIRVLAVALALLSVAFGSRSGAIAASHDTSRAAGYCCSPAQVAAYEARLPVHPLNPEAVVWSVTRLKLINFDTLSSGANASVGTPWGINTIQYFFGFIPPTHGNLTVRTRPHFVLVTEIVGVRWRHGISITAVLPGSHRPAGFMSPWTLVAASPRRHLTFYIESNIPRNRLRLLGTRLLSAANARNPGRSSDSDLKVASTRSMSVHHSFGVWNPEIQLMHKPWVVKQILTTQAVATLCSHHGSAKYSGSVRRYLTAMPLMGPGGGWVGRLFTQPNPHRVHFPGA